MADAADAERTSMPPEADAPAASTSAPAGELEPGSKSGKKEKPRKLYKQLVLPSPEQIAQEDLMNNCGVRTVLSGVMGAGLGAVFGVFMVTMDAAGGGVGGLEPAAEKQTVGQAVRQMLTQTRLRSVSYAKGFAAVGALFAGSECVIEKMRAKHDIYNSVYAGCAAGAVLAHSAGPKGMCLGCASFAAFSALIDKVMEHD